MLQKSFFALFALVIMILIASSVNAQIPQLINYQGVLTNADGSPINGDRPIQFKIYNTASGGNAIWAETQVVGIHDGHFNVLLGSDVPIPPDIFDGGEKFLSIKVENDPEMMPRKSLVSVGYSFHSFNTDHVDGQKLRDNDGAVNQPDDPVSWSKIRDMPPGFADGTDNVGAAGGISQINVGTGMTVANPTGPTATVGLKMGHANGINADMVDGKHAAEFAAASHNHWGALWLGGSSTSTGLRLQGDVPWNNAILIAQNGSNGPGVWGVNYGNGNGVRGFATNSGIGVFGDCDGSGAGISGRSTDGYGVQGKSTNSWSGYFENGLKIPNSKWHGLQIDNTGWAGVWVAKSGYDGFQVTLAGRDGFRVDSVGRDYIRAGSESELDFRVTGNGTAYADGGWKGAADFAELIETEAEASSYEAGDVLIISPNKARSVTLCSQPYSTSVMGIYSTKPGFVGSSHPMQEQYENEIPVAITGIVPCKVSAENGPIRNGDLLTTSSTPGYAMKASKPKIGTILGKALESLEDGKGMIEVLVILQ